MSEVESNHQATMSISVCLCTYNGGPYLRQQLESIQAQTRTPDELVICDDGSSDNTLEIIKEFSSQSSFPVRCHENKQNLGTTKNFEQAIELASGDIVALADQDDVWDREKLRLIEGAFLSSPRIGAVLSDAEIVDEELNPLGHTLWQFLNFTHSSPAGSATLAGLLKRNPAFGTTMAFSTRFKDLILPFPPDVGHDMWTALLIAVVADVALIARPLVKYRQHARQQSVDRAIRTGFRDKLARAKTEGRETILENLRLYQHACRQLATMGHDREHAQAFGLILEKTTHLRTRSNLPGKKLQRLPIALGEFVSLRYHRYSNGSLSLAKDLLL